MPPMNRRDALKAATALVGGVVATTTGVASATLAGGLTGCAPDARKAPATSGVLDGDDQALMADIADTLLPTTAASPGASAAGVGPVINRLLTDCYEPAEQQRVVDGLRTFRDQCRERHGGAFSSLPARQREQFLREVDAEAQRAGSASAAKLGPGGTHGGEGQVNDAHYFGLVRELAERAYFTSEVGMMRALRYVRVPGHWAGCIPLQPNQPAWG